MPGLRTSLTAEYVLLCCESSSSQTSSEAVEQASGAGTQAVMTVTDGADDSVLMAKCAPRATPASDAVAAWSIPSSVEATHP